MKLCPSCGAELDDKIEKCPICEYAFSKAAKPEEKPAAAETGVSSKLEEMKARIEQLARFFPVKEETPAAERKAEEMLPEMEGFPETEEEEGEAQQGEVPEAPEEGEEVEYEEVVIETVRPVGKGAINGLGMPSPTSLRSAKPEKVAYKISSADARKKGGIGRLQIAIAIIVIIIILAASWFVLANRSPTTPVVDGYFDEWTSAVKYKSYFNSNDQEIDFTGCAVLHDSDNVFWYFSVGGDLFSNSDQITTYALFVDSDGDPTTGFLLMPDFGADLALQISGSGGQRMASMTALFEFAGTDAHNWSAWRSAGSLVIGSLGKQAETSFRMTQGFSISNARFMAVSFDGVSTPSATLPFSLTPGILLIQQTTAVGQSGVIAAGQNQPILRLELKGYGAVLAIDELRPAVTGIAQFYNLGPIAWTDEKQMADGISLTVSVNT